MDKRRDVLTYRSQSGGIGFWFLVSPVNLGQIRLQHRKSGGDGIFGYSDFSDSRCAGHLLTAKVEQPLQKGRPNPLFRKIYFRIRCPRHHLGR
jgi:hypothetical protein